MPNKLIHETSPYLLQHAHNPVDWHPWGPEALEKARAEDKPILLSIGYSACHWCPVMERASFEDQDTARLMNHYFVNIKVDREERPDLDAVYMSGVQAMTGRGGWPLTVFLTPDRVPFFGGTYFPPADRAQMPSFRRVLLSVADAYANRRGEVDQTARRLKDALQQGATATLTPRTPRIELLDEAVSALAARYDTAHGGFGEAPKFPQPMILEFLLQTYTRTHDQKLLAMVENTLDRMARGGIYDQLGGGFHRYSTDHRWLVPHFEKMLYDNALLSRVYLHAYQVTGDTFYRRIVEETLDYVRREMTDPQGGFYATQDADSEGEEGKFYLWTAPEIERTLGPEDARVVSRYFGVLDGGNFEGENILHVPEAVEGVARELGISAEEAEQAIERSRPRLLSAREGRIWPGKDDKVITAWNGLMLRSYAEAAGALDRADYREIAVANAEFLLSTLYQDGRLLRTYRAGQAKLYGYLEDYAFCAAGLLALYEATFDLRWFKAARELADAMCQLFWDDTEGGFFETSLDHEPLVRRPKELMDNATPAGNSVAVEVLLRLYRLTGNGAYYDKVARTLQATAELAGQYPTAFGHLLGALDMHFSPSQEIAVLGAPDDPGTQALLAVVRTHYLPRHVIALAGTEEDGAADEFELLEDRYQVNGRPTVYVCENFTCRMPVNEPAALAQQLGIA